MNDSVILVCMIPIGTTKESSHRPGKRGNRAGHSEYIFCEQVLFSGRCRS